MRDMRMPKGWIEIGTINKIQLGENETRVEKMKREKRFSDTIRTMKILSGDALVKESENEHLKNLSNKEKLLAAFNEKKLKSKAMIKKAKGLKKRTAEA